MSEYGSAITSLVSSALRTPVMTSHDRGIVRECLKDMRLHEAPLVKAKLERTGFTMADFAQLIAVGFDRSSPVGRRRWRRMLTAHGLCLRGVELGHDGAFSLERGTLSLCSVRFFTHTDGVPSVLVWVPPVKDSTGKKKIVPMLIAATHGPLEPLDELSHYDALLMQWHEMAAKVAPCGPRCGRRCHRSKTCQRANTPLFQDERGAAASTATLEADAHAALRALGRPLASGNGAHIFRIGGASDYYVMIVVEWALAPETWQEFLLERGRWLDKDCAFIYVRASTELHLHASASVSRVRQRSIEALTAGFGGVTP